MGQNDSDITNALNLSTGLDYISLKDRTFSPIVFKGGAPKINLGFSQNRRDRILWQTDIELSIGSIDHESEYFSSTYYAAQFSFNYLRIIRPDRKSKLYFGSQFSSELNIFEFDGFESAGWYTAQKLEPIFIYKYTISKKQSITGQFSYPIASLVARPNYAGVDEFIITNSTNVSKIVYSRIKFYSLNKLINPDFELKYWHGLRKISIAIGVNYSYLQVNSVRKYYKNDWGLNLDFQFKIGKKREK